MLITRGTVATALWWFVVGSRRGHSAKRNTMLDGGPPTACTVFVGEGTRSRVPAGMSAEADRRLGAAVAGAVCSEYGGSVKSACQPQAVGGRRQGGDQHRKRLRHRVRPPLPSQKPAVRGRRRPDPLDGIFAEEVIRLPKRASQFCAGPPKTTPRDRCGRCRAPARRR